MAQDSAQIHTVTGIVQYGRHEEGDGSAPQLSHVVVRRQVDEKVLIAHAKAQSKKSCIQFDESAGTAGSEAEGIQVLEQQVVFQMGVPRVVLGIPAKVHGEGQGTLMAGGTNENTGDLRNVAIGVERRFRRWVRFGVDGVQPGHGLVLGGYWVSSG